MLHVNDNMNMINAKTRFIKKQLNRNKDIKLHILWTKNGVNGIVR